ncbi:hypothetical protein HGT73_14185 [Rosenbergiella australiborealis]|uniref:Uncharacterized protein n=1 Tax=Rosenbergiella australiborealis TaxID=1544696 RepID=A0ABS5TAP2_9GAMM|nr:hypothetical protein [Rosenbergiella australiborealis]MBT0728492.1 hypothetical protein [Rosenbergiella australiborealis]
MLKKIASAMALTTVFGFSIAHADDKTVTPHSITCKKPPAPPKDVNGKPLPPPKGNKPPMGKDSKPLPPPKEGCIPPHQKG